MRLERFLVIELTHASRKARRLSIATSSNRLVQMNARCNALSMICLSNYSLPNRVLVVRVDQELRKLWTVPDNSPTILIHCAGGLMRPTTAMVIRVDSSRGREVISSEERRAER